MIVDKDLDIISQNGKKSSRSKAVETLRVDNECRYGNCVRLEHFARCGIERIVLRFVVDFKAVLSMLNIDSAGQAL